jgi:hypothetical protein
LPACFTASPNALTASTCACDDVVEHGRRFFLGIAGDHEGVHADSPMAVGSRLGADVVDLRLDAFGVLPLVKYQSDTLAAMSRAARELPPWKISGCGCCSGLG